MSCPVPSAADLSAGEGGGRRQSQTPCRATRRRPMRSAPTGASARAVDAFLSRYAARALFAATVAVALLSSEVAAAPRAVVLEIDGAIGPAVADYVVRELRGIGQSDTRLVILRMNTPGGLDTSMRTIIRAILSSPVPVAAYVAPSGARAASARTPRPARRSTTPWPTSAAWPSSMTATPIGRRRPCARR